MEKVSHILTDYLVNKGKIAIDKSCVYQYGFQIGLEVLINTLISILIAVFLHMEWETLIFFIVFTLLRSYAGGLHMGTYLACLICSCMSLIGLLFIVKCLNCPRFFSLGMLSVSLILVKVLSPILDINRPVNDDDLLKFAKKLNYSIMGIVFLSILLFLLELNRMLFMVSVTTMFMVCILVLGKVRYENSMRKIRQDNQGNA